MGIQIPVVLPMTVDALLRAEGPIAPLFRVALELRQVHLANIQYILAIASSPTLALKHGREDLLELLGGESPCSACVQVRMMGLLKARGVSQCVASLPCECISSWPLTGR